MSCPSLEALAAWILAEQSPEHDEPLEEHLFECDECATKATKLATLIGQLRQALPPILPSARRRKIEESVHPLPRVAVSPGERATITLATSAPLGLWLMRADLVNVARVDCELLTLEGATLTRFCDVPFDPEQGEVVLACQAHYRHLGWPAEMLVRVSAVTEAGERKLGEYRLNHSFSDV